MENERAIMLKRRRCGIISAFGMLTGYLNMTGRTTVQRGMKSRLFLLSELKSWLKSLESISVRISIEKRANSI